jgi:hypothetical protein
MAKKTEKKGYSSRQLAAIVVVVIFAFSTIAFALLSGNTPGEQPPSDNAPVSSQPGTPLNFSATVQATVADILPSMRLSATANLVDIEKIDAAVRAVPGVLAVSSQFNQNPSSPGALLYIADIRVEKGTPLDGVVSLLESNPSSGLTGIQFFPSALFEVPREITFVNKDLNFSREYVFVDQLKPGFVNSQTMKGDSVEAEINAVFTGNELTSLLMYELSNATTAPKLHSIEVSLPVVSLENALIFSQDTNFAPGLTIVDLQQDLNALVDLNGVNVRVQPSGPVEFEVNADFNQSKLVSFFQGLGIQLNTVSNQLPYRYSFEPLSADSYPSIESGIRELLINEGVASDQIVFFSFPVFIKGRLDLSETGSANVPQSVQHIQAVLSSRLPELKIYQLGTVKADSLPENPQDANSATFAVQTGQINVLLFPGQTIGGSVLLNIQFQTERNIATVATGMQVETNSP